MVLYITICCKILFKHDTNFFIAERYYRLLKMVLTLVRNTCRLQKMIILIVNTKLNLDLNLIFTLYM